MKSRKISAAHKTKSKIHREREPLSPKYFVLTGVCGLMLVVGFFGAARQHFASINYGIQNAKLKKQVDELKADQRRLQLNKEIALSPGEIKKSAKRIGFTEMTANNIQAFQPERMSDSVAKSDQSAEKAMLEVSLSKSDELEAKPRKPETKISSTEVKKVDSAEDRSKKS